MTDFRISIEELENEAMIMEMARNLIREAMEQQEKDENPLPISIRIHCHNSLGKIEEQIELPF
jgi:RNA-splicing ligase RtcB